MAACDNDVHTVELGAEAFKQFSDAFRIAHVRLNGMGLAAKLTDSAANGFGFLVAIVVSNSDIATSRSEL